MRSDLFQGGARAGFAIACLLATLGCRSAQTTTLACAGAIGRGADETWVLNLTAAKAAAEMVAHVPADSIDQGVPAGNRVGTVLVSDRAYEVTIPGDSGGQGGRRWVRLQFQFEIDRYTGVGTLRIGEEEYGERTTTPILCKAQSNGPRF